MRSRRLWCLRSGLLIGAGATLVALAAVVSRARVLSTLERVDRKLDAYEREHRPGTDWRGALFAERGFIAAQVAELTSDEIPRVSSWRWSERPCDVDVEIAARLEPLCAQVDAIVASELAREALRATSPAQADAERLLWTTMQATNALCARATSEAAADHDAERFAVRLAHALDLLRLLDDGSAIGAACEHAGQGAVLRALQIGLCDLGLDPAPSAIALEPHLARMERRCDLRGMVALDARAVLDRWRERYRRRSLVDWIRALPEAVGGTWLEAHLIEHEQALGRSELDVGTAPAWYRIVETIDQTRASHAEVARAALALAAEQRATGRWSSHGETRLSPAIRCIADDTRTVLIHDRIASKNELALWVWRR